MCLKLENVTGLDSLNYLALPVRNLPKALRLSSGKSWYPHLYNTAENATYVGPTPDIWHYGVDQMRESERREFLQWYETMKMGRTFENRRAVGRYFRGRPTAFFELSLWRWTTSKCFWCA
jgi:hypothetical protein